MEKTKYMSMSRHQTAGQHHCIEADNTSFENAENFKYLGVMINQNCVQDEIKSRLNSGNACYHVVQISSDIYKHKD
jgi:superfamily II helicase